MKANPKSDKELLIEMQTALVAYPNLPLAQLRTMLHGRSSRIAQAYHSLVSPAENTRRRTFTKAQQQKQHYKEALPKGLTLYTENISIGIEKAAKQIKVRPIALSQYIKQELGEEQFNKISALKRSYQKTLKVPQTRVVSPKIHTEKYVDPHGYILVPTPCWMERENKYSLEHQVVILQAIGLPALPTGWVVHHINEDKTDNRIENLALMTQQGHTSHHQKHTHPLSKLTMWEYEEFMIWKSKQTTAI